tara:strand:+ start:2880 stop:3221 length:342 start_codon:yes stop_codon:yes gene_type:complete
MKIYHNNRCRKSREALEIIKSQQKDFKVIEYLKEKLSNKEISSILTKLKLKPMDLVRTNEIIWKEKYKNKKLTNTDIINIMADNPRLIQRPIIITKNKAILGRDIKKVIDLFN